MTCPLAAKIGPNEGGIGYAKPSGSFLHHFFFVLQSQGGHIFFDWALPSQAAQKYNLNHG